MTTVEVGPFEFDKMPLKKGCAAAGVRVVPHAVVRYGTHVAKDCILMPSYVNLGAYVEERTMVDLGPCWGSCAQIGADVHLSGGVGIGGVLEPLQAAPVIVEDGAFIGSRCIVVEGVHVGKEAVLGANVVLTASTPIPSMFEALRPSKRAVRFRQGPLSFQAHVPKRFQPVHSQVPCALIIGGARRAPTEKLP